MAILNKIRQKTVVLILVIALALFAFILSSLFDNKDALFNKSPNVVATINGKDISREDFMARVEARNNPNTTQSQIMNQVYDAQVRQIVMQSQFDKLGLSVGREQIRDLLKTNLATSPQFLNADGVFDENILNNYIANLKETSPQAYQQWIDYEQNVSSGALQQNYINMVKAATTATVAEGALEHKLEGDKVDLKYVYVPFASIPDSTIAVSKSEISTYINNNKKKYEAEASVNLQYVKFDQVASKEDEENLKNELTKLLTNRVEYNNGKNDTIAGFSTITTKEAEAFVNANTDNEAKYQDKYQYTSSLAKPLQDTISKLKIGDVYGPYKDGNIFKVSKLLSKRQLADSIQSSHIIVPFIGSQAATPETKKTKEQAKATIDSIFRLVKNNKTKYAEIANQINTDGSKGNDGSIGWVRLTTYNPAAFDPDFANFLFFNKTGAIDVVETKFGYHIIRIDNKKNVDTAYKFATIERKIEPSIETEDAIFRNASNFEVALDNKAFLEVSKENNLKVKPVTTVKELDENIPGVGAQRPVVRWAFEEETKVGDTKRFEIPDGYIVVQVTAKNEAGLMNVEDASVTALPAIRKEKKAKQIKAGIVATTLEDFAANQNQKTKTALAINMKNPTISSVGKEPIVVGHAFGLNEGEVSKPIVGEKGVFMVQVTKKTPAVELDNYQSFANRVSQEKLNAVNTRLYNALKEAAEIEDYRAKTIQ